MSGADELYPPGQYGWGWMLLAFGVLALLVLVAWLVLLLTREKRERPTEAVEPPMSLAEVRLALREENMRSIQQIEDDYRSGAIDARRAHLEYSRVVRRFVNEYSGLEAPVLALDDLVRLGVHPSLVEAMQRSYYPSIFRRADPLDPYVGAAAARQVVQSWH